MHNTHRIHSDSTERNFRSSASDVTASHKLLQPGLCDLHAGFDKNVWRPCTCDIKYNLWWPCTNTNSFCTVSAYLVERWPNRRMEAEQKQRKKTKMS